MTARSPALATAALVLGGAEGVFEEAEGVNDAVGVPWPGVVVAVNEAAIEYEGRVDHLATVHPEHVEGWINESGSFAGGRPAVWSTTRHPSVDRVVQPWGPGTSGLLAVAVCRSIGCAKVVLCGVPLDGRPHFRSGTPWGGYMAARRAWRPVLGEMEGWVRSRSGWTREQLGDVTREWLGAA